FPNEAEIVQGFLPIEVPLPCLRKKSDRPSIVPDLLTDLSLGLFLECLNNGYVHIEDKVLSHLQSPPPDPFQIPGPEPDQYEDHEIRQHQSLLFQRFVQ